MVTKKNVEEGEGVRRSRGAGVLLVEGGDFGKVGVKDGLTQLLLGANVVFAVAGLELAKSGCLGDRDGGDEHCERREENKEFHERRLLIETSAITFF